MLKLHYAPGNASFTPHLLLREMGVPFELVLVDRAVQAHKQVAYLALNPNGLIPVLQDGDLVLFETGAIILHLVDRHPQAGLAPALGSLERALFYRQLFWLGNHLQAMAPHYFYSDRMVAAGNASGAAEVKAAAEAAMGRALDLLEAQFAAHVKTTGQATDSASASSGPWVMGAKFSALDPYAFMLCRWTRGFAHPARSRPHLAQFLARMLERNTVRATFEAEGLQAPYV